MCRSASNSGNRQFRGRSNAGVIPEDRAGVPNWKVDERFKKDVFTFVRIEYDSFGGRGGGRPGRFDGGWGWVVGWLTDLPDSDLNFSLPPPATDVAQGQPRSDHDAADRRSALRLPLHLHHRAGRLVVLARKKRSLCAAICSMAAS